MKKNLFIISGFILLCLGLIGIILPILPTVPFLLLASFCFLKSSQKLHTWFRKTKIYRNYVEKYKAQKGMTLKTKLCILIPVYIVLITLCIIKNILAIRIVIGILLVIKTIVFLKIKTIKENKTNDVKQTTDQTVWEK